MSRENNSIPPQIDSYVRKFVRVQRRRRFYAAVAAAVVVSCAWLLAVCLIDRHWPLPPRVRFGLLIGNAIIVALLLARSVWSMLFARIDKVAAAADIEQRDARFEQRLETVVSQFLTNPRLRGSAEILGQLSDQVQQDAATIRAAKLVPFRPVAMRWFAAIVAVAIVGAGWKIPRLHLREQIARCYRPSEMRIREIPTPPIVAQVAVSPPPPTQPVEPPKPQPAIRALQIKLTYPAYLARPTTMASNVETVAVPTGTELEVSITSDQPLSSATLEAAGQSIPTTQAAEKNRRVAKIVVSKDATYQLKIADTSGAVIDSGKELKVAAMADRAPTIRLIRPRGDGVIATNQAGEISFETSDDFGVASVVAEVTITSAANGASRAMRLAVPVPVEPRGAFKLLFSRLHVARGDVVTVTLQARDAARQAASSETLRFVVASSRQAIAQLPLPELRDAALSADALTKTIDAAAQEFDALAATKDEKQMLAARAKLGRSLAAADATAGASQTALLRIAVLCGHDALPAAENLNDAAQSLLDDLHDVREKFGRTALDKPAVLQLQQTARDQNQKIATLLKGTLASALQAQLAPQIRAARALTRREARAMAIAMRVTKERTPVISASAQELGLNVAAGDLSARVAQLVADGEKIARGGASPDALELAKQWAGIVRQQPAVAERLERRMALRARIAVMRDDVEGVHADDMQLAAAAAARIRRSAPTTAPAEPLVGEFSAAVASIVESYHPPATTGPATQPQPIAARADAARKALASMAGGQSAEDKTSTANIALQRTRHDALAAAKSAIVALPLLRDSIWEDQAMALASTAPPAAATQPSHLEQAPPSYREAIAAYFQALARDAQKPPAK